MEDDIDPNWQTLDAATMGRQTHTSLSSNDALVGGGAQPGSVLNGRYTVVRAIAHGGMGWVYDVKDALHPERAVALKVVRGLSGSPARLSLFKAEFSTMAKLEHPNVARVYDFEELQGGNDFLMTMERVDGEPLHRALRDTKAWQIVLPHVVQVCRALSYVHSRRIVHFDLKPANILVDASGSVRVVDFGIAGAEPASHQGGIMGTPQYMAPELLLGTGSADHRADLYALGITLFELLTGDVPCPTRDVWALARWLNEGGVRVEPQANIPAWLAAVIERLCAADPADRYPNANGVIHAMNAGGGFSHELETAETRQSYVMSPRFSGRDQELSRVMDFITHRLRGRGDQAMLMLSGLSGIGKSRLMKEARRTAQLQRLVFLEASCYEMNLVEYGPLAEVLHQLVPLVETLGGIGIVQRALPALVKLAPRLANGRSYEPSPALNAESERAHLLETTADFLLEAARVVPFVIYMNDLQWSGRGPAELLAYVARRIMDDQAQGEAPKLALIGSFRSDEVEGRALEDLLKVLHKRGIALEIELRPLSRGDITAVVSSMLGIDDVPDAFLSRISEETAGNPFFVQEVMRVLFENGSVFLDHGRWTTHDSVGQLQLPASMADVFRRRFNLLTSDEQDLVTLLAVHGRPLSVERMSEILGKTGERISALRDLEKKQIVIRQAGQGLAYNVAHDRMRETVYRDLPETDRRRWHRRIGEMLELSAGALDDSDKPLDDLARHFNEANVDDKACAYSLSAGKRAFAHFSNEAAAEHFANAIRLMAPADPRHAETTESRADALARLYRYEHALALYQALAETLQERSARARMCRKMAAIYIERTQLEEAKEKGWNAIELLGDRRPSGRIGLAVATLHEGLKFFLVRAGMRWLAGRRENASQLAGAYAALRRIYFSDDPLAFSYLILRSWRYVATSPNLAERGRFESSVAQLVGFAGLRTLSFSLFREALEHALAAGSPREIAVCLYSREMVARAAGDWRAGIEPLERSIGALKKAGELYDLGHGHINLADILFYTGDVAASHRCVAAYNRDAFRITDAPMLAKLTLSQEALCLTYLERSDAIEEKFSLAESIAVRGQDSFGYVLILSRVGQSLLARGRPEEAIVKLETAMALRQEKHFFDNYTAELLFLLPRAYLRTQGLSAPRQRQLRKLQRKALRQTRRRHANWRAPTLVNEALLQERCGRPKKADEWFAAAVAVAQAQEAGFFVSDALYEWGISLSARGAFERAAQCLQQAREMAASGGNHLRERLCEEALAGLGSSPSCASPTP